MKVTTDSSLKRQSFTRVKQGQPIQDGFTIIELMIATSIVSIIILIASVIIISISNLYSKGSIQSSTQDAMRSISDQLASDLEFTTQPLQSAISTTFPGYGTIVTPLGSHQVGVQAYCIGSVRYSYIIGYKLGSLTSRDGVAQNYGDVPHVLWRDSISAGSPCNPVNLFNITTPGSELMPTNSRLTDFEISPGGSPYTFKVSIAYGDYDLLSGGYKPSSTPDYDLTCAGGTGDQFCATSHLTTTVDSRQIQ